MRLLVCVDRQKKGLHELFERRVNARGSSRRPGWRPWTPLQIYIVVLVSPTEILLLRVTRGYQAVLVESVAPAGFRQYGRFWWQRTRHPPPGEQGNGPGPGHHPRRADEWHWRTLPRRISTSCKPR